MMRLALTVGAAAALAFAILLVAALGKQPTGGISGFGAPSAVPNPGMTVTCGNNDPIRVIDLKLHASRNLMCKVGETFEVNFGTQ